MKKSLLLRIASVLGVAVMLFTFGACQPKDPCKNVQKPEDNRSFEEQVRAYLEHYQEAEGGPIIKGQYAAYFDFSDGMEDAYKNYREPVLKQIVTAAFDKHCEMFGLESGEIVSLKDWSDQSLFNHICEDKYEKIEAPIQAAMEQIVKSKKPSLLVSDLEEYTLDSQKKAKGVCQNAYAHDCFKDWLKMGGVINFYSLDYKEKELNKKLFFVVFDGSDKQLISQIETFMKTTGKDFDVFKLQTSPYRVYTDYSVGKGGNFIDSDGDDPLDFKYAVFEDLNAETYYNTEMYSWLQIAEQLMRFRDEKFTGLLSKLYVDLSDTQSSNIDKLELKVTDITDDFNSFTNNQFALSAVSAPEKSDDGTDTRDCVQKYFYDADGELSAEYQSKPVNQSAVTKFLEINQDAFEKSRMSDPKRTEIVIDFNNEYSDTSMYDQEKGLYWLRKREELKDKVNGRILKVEVCIAGRGGSTSFEELERKFNFKSYEIKDGKKNYREMVDNRCITNSVFGALNQLEKNDEKTVIYTYIIKDYPDGYVSRKEN